MSILESDWWTLELPPEWRAQQDDDSVVITDVDEVGDICLTTLQAESGTFSEEDLAAIIRESELAPESGKPARLGEFTGWYFELEEEGEFIREWYLAQGDLLLLINYCCEDGNRDMDRDVVDQILGTLQLK